MHASSLITSKSVSDALWTSSGRFPLGFDVSSASLNSDSVRYTASFGTTVSSRRALPSLLTVFAEGSGGYDHYSWNEFTTVYTPRS